MHTTQAEVMYVIVNFSERALRRLEFEVGVLGAGVFEAGQ